MLNIDEINEEIARLEKCDCTNYNVCEKLAILYIVREYYNKGVSNRTGINNSTMTKAPMQQVGM